jgi:hypothetical protein
MKTPFEIVNKVSLADIDEDNIIYVNLSTTKTVTGHIINMSAKDYTSLINKNKVDADTFDINNYRNKKCYILPGNTRTLERYKEILKNYDITIVNKHDKADFIISNTNHIDKDMEYDPSIMLSKNKTFYNCNGYRIKGYQIEFDKPHDTFLERMFYFNYNIDPVWNNAYNRASAFKRMQYLVGGTYINIVESGKPIVDEELLKQIETKIVLTRDIYENIRNMLSSRDKSNRLIVAKMLPTIDYTKNQDIVFEFFQECRYEINNMFNKDKDVKNWLNDSCAGMFYRPVQYIINHFHNNDKLTAKGFRYLEKQARKEISIANRELYNFKVELKDEYKKYFKKGAAAP